MQMLSSLATATTSLPPAAPQRAQYCREDLLCVPARTWGAQTPRGPKGSYLRKCAMINLSLLSEMQSYHPELSPRGPGSCHSEMPRSVKVAGPSLVAVGGGAHGSGPHPDLWQPLVAGVAPACKPARPSYLKEPVPDSARPHPVDCWSPDSSHALARPGLLCRMEAKFSSCWTPLPDAVALWIRSVPVTLRGRGRKPAHQRVSCPVLFPQHMPNHPGSRLGP